jgi:hypothetical protein
MDGEGRCRIRLRMYQFDYASVRQHTGNRSSALGLGCRCLHLLSVLPVCRCAVDAENRAGGEIQRLPNGRYIAYTVGMPPNNEPRISKLVKRWLPNATQEELATAQTSLDRMTAVVYRICDRLAREEVEGRDKSRGSDTVSDNENV